MATYGCNSCGLDWDGVALATGQDFPDALAGGVMQGAGSSVMLLTPSTKLDSGVATKLKAEKAGIGEVRYLGGTSAVSQTVRDAVSAILK